MSFKNFKNKERSYKMSKIKDNRRIHIPISEYDIDTFQNLIIERTDHIDWTFETDDGERIDLRFVREEDNE